MWNDHFFIFLNKVFEGATSKNVSRSPFPSINMCSRCTQNAKNLTFSQLIILFEVLYYIEVIDYSSATSGEVLYPPRIKTNTSILVASVEPCVLLVTGKRRRCEICERNRHYSKWFFRPTDRISFESSCEFWNQWMMPSLHISKKWNSKKISAFQQVSSKEQINR